MRLRELAVPGAWEISPVQHGDPRGVFLEWFRGDRLSESIGHRFSLAQGNCSVSAAGVVRGIHLADVPPGQAKYVTCPAGAVLDVVVDLRVGSPTYGRHDTVLLDDVDRRAVYLAEGLGHAFCSLADGSVLVYLTSTAYEPARERAVHPLDPALGIGWPSTDRAGAPMPLSLSARDEAAPTLAEALAAGVLPSASACERLPRNGSRG